MNQVEAGTKVGHVCRQHGLPNATFCKWQEKCDSIRNHLGIGDS
ncbi:MAG: transposase [Mailhella sp.]|nr:transposase [Mailhella sp.]